MEELIFARSKSICCAIISSTRQNAFLWSIFTNSGRFVEMARLRSARLRPAAKHVSFSGGSLAYSGTGYRNLSSSIWHSCELSEGSSRNPFPGTMEEAAKRRWYWPFGQNKYRQMQRGSNPDEIELDRFRLREQASEESSVASKLVPCLPRNLQNRIKRGQENQQEWITGVVLCACGTFIILSLNVILTIIAAAIFYSKPQEQESISALLYQGKCSVSKNWARGLHFLINVLSTLMLAASNFCMQCLSSPSRDEVDIAHAQGKWLDVGVPSLKNLASIGVKQRMLWLALLVTSLPIHLLYNSAIFSSLATNEYGVILMSSDLDYNKDPDHSNCFQQHINMNESTFDSKFRSFQNLAKQKCIETYAADFVTDRRTLILVSKDLTDNDSLRFVGTGQQPASYFDTVPDPYGWMCDEISCTTDNPQELVNRSFKEAAAWAAPALSANFHLNASYAVNITQRYDTGNNIWLLEGDLDRDVKHLQNFMASYPEEQQLKQYLNDATHWRNSSWAKQIMVQENGYACPPITKDTHGLYSHPSNPFKEYRSSAEERPIAFDYCLSERVNEKCQLYFSPPICLVVILCNVVKVICMFLTIRGNKKGIFLTVGDAISSFLSRPDVTTQGECLLSVSKINSRHSSKIFFSQKNDTTLLPKRKRWAQAVSFIYWMMMIALSVSVISVSSYLLSLAFSGFSKRGYQRSIKYLWNLGFGSATTRTTIYQFLNSSYVLLVFLANTPQLIVSVVYFLYNNVLTKMLLAHEYDSYGVQRKPLRVSWPKEKQRSTYYLSLPYRYSIPLLVTSAVLHWLVSQSFFFVAIIPFDIREKSEGSYRAFSCGYSPMAIILAISVGGLMILAILCLGMRGFKSDIPIAGSCSAAISAACHPLAGKGHELRAVQWGEIQTPSEHDTISTQATKQASFRTKPSLQVSVFETEEGSSTNKKQQDKRPRSVSSLQSIGLDAGEESSTNQEQLAGSRVYLLDPVEHGSYGVGEGHGHCSFTSGEVITPRPGRLYA